MVTRVKKIDGKVIGFYQLDIKLNDVVRRWAALRGISKASAAEVLIAAHYDTMVSEIAKSQRATDEQLKTNRPAIVVSATENLEERKNKLKEVVEDVRADIFAGGFITEKDYDEHTRQDDD